MELLHPCNYYLTTQCSKVQYVSQ